MEEIERGVMASVTPSNEDDQTTLALQCDGETLLVNAAIWRETFPVIKDMLNDTCDRTPITLPFNMHVMRLVDWIARKGLKYVYYLARTPKTWESIDLLCVENDNESVDMNRKLLRQVLTALDFLDTEPVMFCTSVIAGLAPYHMQIAGLRFLLNDAFVKGLIPRSIRSLGPIRIVQILLDGDADERAHMWGMIEAAAAFVITGIMDDICKTPQEELDLSYVHVMSAIGGLSSVRYAKDAILDYGRTIAPFIQRNPALLCFAINMKLAGRMHKIRYVFQRDFEDVDLPQTPDRRFLCDRFTRVRLHFTDGTAYDTWIDKGLTPLFDSMRLAEPLSKPDKREWFDLQTVRLSRPYDVEQFIQGFETLLLQIAVVKYKFVGTRGVSFPCLHEIDNLSRWWQIMNVSYIFPEVAAIFAEIASKSIDLLLPQQFHALAKEQLRAEVPEIIEHIINCRPHDRAKIDMYCRMSATDIFTGRIFPTVDNIPPEITCFLPSKMHT